MKSPIEIMKDVIQERKKSNHRLSLRSIAYKMEIPSGRLSEILNGKRPLTEYYLEKFCCTLKLNAPVVEELRRSYQQIKPGTSRSSQNEGYGTLLTPSQIEWLSNWKPYAVMSLLQTEGYIDQCKNSETAQSQTQWIGRTLGFAHDEAHSLLSLMGQVSLIRWDENRWIPTYAEATTGYDVPNKVIQESMVQDLLLAKERLAEVDVSRRDYSSVTIAINPKDMLKAKKMIRKFRRDFAKCLEKGKKKEVYQISIQLFPLTKTGDLV